MLESDDERGLDGHRCAGELDGLETRQQLQPEGTLGLPGQVRPEAEVLTDAEPDPYWAGYARAVREGWN